MFNTKFFDRTHQSGLLMNIAAPAATTGGPGGGTAQSDPNAQAQGTASHGSQPPSGGAPPQAPPPAVWHFETIVAESAAREGVKVLGIATRHDLEEYGNIMNSAIEGARDDVKQTVEGVGKRIYSEMARPGDLSGLATKNDVGSLLKKGDLGGLATTKDIESKANEIVGKLDGHRTEGVKFAGIVFGLLGLALLLGFFWWLSTRGNAGATNGRLDQMEKSNQEIAKKLDEQNKKLNEIKGAVFDANGNAIVAGIGQLQKDVDKVQENVGKVQTETGKIKGAVMRVTKKGREITVLKVSEQGQKNGLTKSDLDNLATSTQVNGLGNEIRSRTLLSVAKGRSVLVTGRE